MLTKVLLSLAFILLVIPAAHAASFDCARAATAIEKAICTDPELSRTDELLAKAYATATGGLSGAALTTMKDGQRNWLAYRDAACADDALNDTDDLDAARRACLVTAYASRIRTLENSRMAGGLRFYNVDRYAVVPDPEPTEFGSRVATKALSYPLIDGDDALAGAFNRFMKDEVAPLEAMFGPPTGKDDDLAAGYQDDEISYKAKATAWGPVTVTVETYWFGHGAAHGNYTITYRHFMRDELRPVVAGDVFQKPGWRQDLHRLVVAALKDQLGDMLQLDDPSSIDPIITDPAHWDFTDADLVVQFSPYDVAAYAAGAIRAAIPWVRLEDDLGPDAYKATGR